MHKNLYFHVALFHDTILEIKNLLSDEFKYFPTGSCGSTCLLLGTYLNESGFGKFKYISGEKYFWDGYSNQEYSHSWLESEDSLIIDITAYQFPEIKEKILVQKKNSWYKDWAITQTFDDVNIFHETYAIPTDKINYEIIISNIKSKNKIENFTLRQAQAPRQF